MRARLAAPILMLLLAATPAFGHRLDEYLQAAMVDVQKDHVAVEIRLTPGVAVLHTMLSAIDTDGDGAISQAEQRAYEQRVLHDLSITLDGKRLELRLVSSKFPKIEEMKEGLGEIVLALEAPAPLGRANRRLVFENHHQREIGAYLVNCVAPTDPEIRVATQNRNNDQSFYQLDYTQAGQHATQLTSASWSSIRGWLIADGAVLLASVILLSRRRGAMCRNTSHADDVQTRSDAHRG